jgi:outer membrane protein TolC
MNDLRSVNAGQRRTSANTRTAWQMVRLLERLDVAYGEGNVDVSLFGSYMRMDAGFPQSGVGAGGSLERVRGQFNYVAIGATVALPLLNRNQGQVAAATADRIGAEARRDATVLVAGSEVAAARVRDTRAREVAALYQGRARVLQSRDARAAGRSSPPGAGACPRPPAGAV